MLNILYNQLKFNSLYQNKRSLKRKVDKKVNKKKTIIQKGISLNVTNKSITRIIKTKLYKKKSNKKIN